MSTHLHDWKASESTDGELHHCSECGATIKAQGGQVLGAEHTAVAWHGSAGLYRSRLEAVQNGEQRVEPVSVDQLFTYARALVCMQINERRKAKSTITGTDEGDSL